MLCPLNHWSKGNSSFLFFMPYTKFIQRVVNSYHFKKLSKCISQLQLKVNIYSKRTLSRNLWFQTWNDVVMLELTTVFFISMMFFFFFFFFWGGEGQPCFWFFYSLTTCLYHRLCSRSHDAVVTWEEATHLPCNSMVFLKNS